MGKNSSTGDGIINKQMSAKYESNLHVYLLLIKIESKSYEYHFSEKSKLKIFLNKFSSAVGEKWVAFWEPASDSHMNLSRY